MQIINEIYLFNKVFMEEMKVSNNMPPPPPKTNIDTGISIFFFFFMIYQKIEERVLHPSNEY